MPQEHKENKADQDLESKIVSDFHSHRENTMKYAPSVSVAVAMKTLEETYLSQYTPEQIEQEYKICVAELRETIRESKDDALGVSVENIIKKAQEPLDGVLDRVTFCLPKSTESKADDNKYIEVTREFPIKKALILVWKAQRDHKRLMHNYTDAEEKELKLKSAEKDFPKRLESFFNRLKLIKLKPICHKGIRHDLISLLNEIHPDVKIIEDERMTIFAFLRDKINVLFWKCYAESNSNDRKKALTTALFIWMRDSNPKKLLQEIDPTNTIFKELSRYFIAHGCNPKIIKLEELIEEALPSLSYPYDEQQQPALAMVHSILTAVELHEDHSRAKALEHMQNWIIATYQPGHIEQQSEVATFYTLYQASKNLEDYQFLLNVTGNFEQFNDLKKACEAYFSNGAAPTKKDFATVIVLSKTIRKIKEDDKLISEFENFFAHWFIAEEGPEQHLAARQRLYGIFLDKTTRAKILIDDETIQDFINQGYIKEEGVVGIGPYEINRIFLHALWVNPEKWSTNFRFTFHVVRKFVENKFNEENHGRARSLKKNSYPKELFRLFDYLFQASDKRKQGVAIPENLIVNPENLQNIEEWMQISAYFINDEQREKFYFTQVIKIKKLIKDKLNTFQECGNLFLGKILKTLPPKVRIFFLKQHAKKSSYFNIDLFHIILELIPRNEILSCINMLEINTIFADLGLQDRLIALLSTPGKLIILEEFTIDVSTPEHLNRILHRFSPEERLNCILELLSLNFPRKGLFNLVLEFLKIIPVNERAARLRSLNINLYPAFPFSDPIAFLIDNNIQNVKEIIALLPIDQRFEFLKKYGIRYELNEDLTAQLQACLKYLPKEQRLDGFLVFRQDRKSLKIPRYWIENNIPKNQWLYFANHCSDITGIETFIKITLNSLSPDERWSFIKWATDKHNECNIVDGEILFFYLKKYVLKQDRLNVILELNIENQAIIRDINDLMKITDALPQVQRFTFFRRHAKFFIKNQPIMFLFEWDSVLEIVPPEEHLNFILELDISFNKARIFDLRKLQGVLKNNFPAFLVQNKIDIPLLFDLILREVNYKSNAFFWSTNECKSDNNVRGLVPDFEKRFIILDKHFSEKTNKYDYENYQFCKNLIRELAENFTFYPADELPCDERPVLGL